MLACATEEIVIVWQRWAKTPQERLKCLQQDLKCGGSLRKLWHGQQEIGPQISSWCQGVAEDVMELSQFLGVRHTCRKTQTCGFTFWWGFQIQTASYWWFSYADCCCCFEEWQQLGASRKTSRWQKRRKMATKTGAIKSRTILCLVVEHVITEHLQVLKL